MTPAASGEDATPVVPSPRLRKNSTLRCRTTLIRTLRLRRTELQHPRQPRRTSWRRFERYVCSIQLTLRDETNSSTVYTLLIHPSLNRLRMSCRVLLLPYSCSFRRLFHTPTVLHHSHQNDNKITHLPGCLSLLTSSLDLARRDFTYLRLCLIRFPFSEITMLVRR